jgi:hypothetical protein
MLRVINEKNVDFQVISQLKQNVDDLPLFFMFVGLNHMVLLQRY